MRRLALLALFAVAGCGTDTPHLKTVTTQSGVLASWSEADSTAVGYNLYREDGSSGFARVNPSPIAATWYTDSSVTDGQTYTYEIKAVNAAGLESDPSASATIYVP